MGCCPRIPAVSTWDTAANKKRSVLRALRKAKIKEETSLDATQQVSVENKE